MAAEPMELVTWMQKHGFEAAENIETPTPWFMATLLKFNKAPEKLGKEFFQPSFFRAML